MSTATQSRPKKKAVTVPPAKFAFGGTLVLPDRARPSKALDRNSYADFLRSAWLVERGEDMWLLSTNAYLAVAIKLKERSTLKPGPVPAGVLAAIEGKTAKALFGVTVKQVDEVTWTVRYPDREIKLWSSADPAKAPDKSIAALGLWDDKKAPRGELGQFGVNAEFMVAVQRALGVDALCVEPGADPTKAVRLLPTAFSQRAERRAMVMPTRLDV